MWAFSRNNVIIGLSQHNTDSKDWPSRDILRWDQVSCIKNDALNAQGLPLHIGDLLTTEMLEYSPIELQELYAHVTITPLEGGSYSNSGLPGAPNSGKSGLHIRATLRFGRDDNSQILPISDSWILSIINSTLTYELKIKIRFTDGNSEFDYLTNGKPVGTFHIDEKDFAKVPLTEETLTVLGISGTPGLWQIVLAQPVYFDIYEEATI